MINFFLLKPHRMVSHMVLWAFTWFMQSVGFEYLKLLVMYKIPNDVERPVRGTGPWSGSHAGGADREVMLSRVAAKTRRMEKKNSRLMEEMNPTKLHRVSVMWAELASLEKSRQHCVEAGKIISGLPF